jgi:hypothetical protein
MVKDISEKYNFGRIIIMLVCSFICAITSKRLSGFSVIVFTGFIILFSIFNVASISSSNLWSPLMTQQAMAQILPPDNGPQGQGGQFGPSPSGQNPTNGNFLQYQDPNFGYTISYPVGSQIQPGETGVVIINMPQGIATIGVVDNSQQRSMDHYTSELLVHLGQTFNSFKILNRGVDSLSGSPSRFITFSFIDDNGNQRIGSYSWTLIGDRAYELGFATSPEQSAIVPIMKEMLSSFRVAGVGQQGGGGQFGPSPSGQFPSQGGSTDNGPQGQGGQFGASNGGIANNGQSVNSSVPFWQSGNP